MALSPILILRILLSGATIVLGICIVLYWKYRQYGIPVWGMIPILNSIYFRSKAKKEIKDSEKGMVYNAVGADDTDGTKFRAFLRDLPKYQIDDGILAAHIRTLMKIAGAEYKQIVLVDKSNISDKRVWVRKVGLMFVNGKGTYFYPWECIKDINYYDLIDSRPLIDMTKDMDWYNPEMCADVITAVTNTNAMRSMSEDALEQISKTLQYVVIILVVVAGATLLGIYLNYKNTEIITSMLMNMSQRI